VQNLDRFTIKQNEYKKFYWQTANGKRNFWKNLFLGILIFSLILGVSGLTSAKVQTMPVENSADGQQTHHACQQAVRELPKMNPCYCDNI